jgi:hypothetical protein
VPDQDSESALDDGLLEQFDEVDDEVAAMSAASLAMESDPADPVVEGWKLAEATNAEEEAAAVRQAFVAEQVSDYAALAEGFDRHPENKVKLFDFEGQPVGFGLKAGEDDRGVLIQVAEDAVDVTARAEDANGPIANAVFIHVRPTVEE